MQPLYSRRSGGVYGVHDRYSGGTIGYVMRDSERPQKWRAVRRASTGEVIPLPGLFASRREATEEVTNP